MKMRSCFAKVSLRLILSFSLLFNFLAPGKALAFDVGGLIGAVISSAAQQASIIKWIHYYDTDGREELFEAYKDSFAARHDPKLNILLGNVVERLSNEVAKKDISIIDRPYNYFIALDKRFNAACGLGHTMFVNEGVFTFINNNEDQLAAVVAHEMIHGQNDHNLKGIKKQLSTIFLRNVIGSQIGNYGGQVLLNIATINVINTGITKPNEWEADNLSYPILTAAGYNPGAPAALWHRISESAEMKTKSNFLAKVLSPSTHPGSKERRDNFSQKLTEHSKNNVTVDATTGEIKIKGQTFMTPADIEKVASGKERAYMIAGNLASLYATGEELGEAKAHGNSVMIGEKTIVQATANDTSAQELASILNSIK